MISIADRVPQRCLAERMASGVPESEAMIETKKMSGKAHTPTTIAVIRSTLSIQARSSALMFRSRRSGPLVITKSKDI